MGKQREKSEFQKIQVNLSLYLSNKKWIRKGTKSKEFPDVNQNYIEIDIKINQKWTKER